MKTKHREINWELDLAVLRVVYQGPFHNYTLRIRLLWIFHLSRNKGPSPKWLLSRRKLRYEPWGLEIGWWCLSVFLGVERDDVQLWRLRRAVWKLAKAEQYAERQILSDVLSPEPPPDRA